MEIKNLKLKNGGLLRLTHVSNEAIGYTWIIRVWTQPGMIHVQTRKAMLTLSRWWKPVLTQNYEEIEWEQVHED